MARHDRYELRQVYQPTTPRQAYGRRPGSRIVVEELPFTVSVRHVSDAPAPTALVVAGGARRLAQPMPRGGVRWVLECPCCGRHVRQLYYCADLWDDPHFSHFPSGLCRVCWGFAYRSQYAGRRPEADHARVEALRQQAAQTHDPQVKARRLQRARRADETRIRRAVAHDERQWQALELAVAPLLARAEVIERQRWNRVLRRAFRLPTDTRSALALDLWGRAEAIAENEGAAAARWWRWTVAVLAASIESDADDALAAPSAAAVAAAITVALDALDDQQIITPERLAALRAAYVAQTQRRLARRHVAA